MRTISQYEETCTSLVAYLSLWSAYTLYVPSMNQDKQSYPTGIMIRFQMIMFYSIVIQHCYIAYKNVYIAVLDVN